MKNIILAKSAGFCFGVKRAVQICLNTQQKYNRRIYTLGPLIHNDDVVEFLKNKSIFPISIDEINSLNKEDVVIIRSHGVPKEVYNNLISNNLIIVDATCPYVKNIHNKVEKYHNDGYKIIIVGDKTHPEVIGINGWCDNTAIIAKSENDILDLKTNKVCIVSQTTEKQEVFKKIVNKVIEKCKEITIFNTICSATTIRQNAAEELSSEVECMLVVGGKHSSNTTKLYQICKQNCNLTFHIDNVKEIPSEIINSKINIGVTAGASTPEWIIKEVISVMENQNLEMNEQLKFMEENEVDLYVGKKVKGEVISVTENELFINLGYKADALLPIKEVTKDEDVSLEEMFKLGDMVEAKIITLKNKEGNVVLSRIELEKEKSYVELNEAFENGNTITVTVKEVVKGGVLASYNNIRVFIPASHIELYHVKDLNQFIGQKLEVILLEYSKGRRGTKIIASRKELLKKEKEKIQNQTWSEIQKGDIVEGVVRRLTSFGAFVEINGIDGLLHISEISWGRVSKVDEVLKIGDKVKVCVLEANKDEKKLSLSIKQLTQDPWVNIAEKYPVDNVVLGKIVRFTTFGAFIELEPGVDALVHVSQIRHDRTEKPQDVLTIGDNIKAKIIDINVENRKIALSIKALDEI